MAHYDCDGRPCAGYLVSRYEKGSDGKTAIKRLRGRDSNQAIVEFGEQVWAKPQRTNAWKKQATLASRWTAATWVGIFARTGEHQVILPEGGASFACQDGKKKT